MTKLNIATILAALIIFCIAICNIPSAPADVRCETAHPLRSTFDGQIWTTDYKADDGNIWQVYEDSRPEVNKQYVLIIIDNEVTDII